MANEKRVRIAMEDFITAWEQSASVREVADRLGIQATSVMARASKYRSEPFNIPLKNFQRGGGAKLDVSGAKELLAKLRNVTVEAIATDSATLAKKHAEKATG